MKTQAHPFLALLLLATIIDYGITQEPTPKPPGAATPEPPVKLLMQSQRPEPSTPVAGMLPSPAAPPGSTGVKMGSPRAAQDFIRETKLKVLQRHYEETSKQLLELGKAKALADLQGQKPLAEKEAALRTYLLGVEHELAEIMPKVTPTMDGNNTLSKQPEQLPQGSGVIDRNR